MIDSFPVQKIVDFVSGFDLTIWMSMAAVAGSLYAIKSIFSGMFTSLFSFLKYLFFVELEIRYTTKTHSYFAVWYKDNIDSFYMTKSYKIQTLDSEIVSNNDSLGSKNTEALSIGYDTNAYYFSWRYGLLIIKRQEVEKKSLYLETDVIKVKFFGFTKNVINKFLYDITPSSVSLPKVYKQTDGYWADAGIIRDVSMPVSQSFDAFQHDISNFLKSRKLYETYKRVYKRGYLLYGPPGTGKTSMVLYIARTLGLDIYTVDNPSSLNIFNIKEIKRPSIVLIEDVDMTELGSSRNLHNIVDNNALSQTDYIDYGNDDDNDEDNDDDNAIAKNDIQNKTGEIAQYDSKNDLFNSLKEPAIRHFMNLMDGVVNVDGLIIVFTTNRAECLDGALLRSGRIDKKIYVSYLEPSDCLKFYNQFFGDSLSICDLDKTISFADMMNIYDICLYDKESIQKQLLLS